MNNQENSFPKSKLKEDIKKERNSLKRQEEEEAKKAKKEELTDVDEKENRKILIEEEISSRPREILVDELKVSPERLVDLEANFYGKEVREGETIILLVGEEMKKKKAKFVQFIKGTKDTKATIRVLLLDE